MFANQLYSNMKEYFEHNGVKENESEKDIPYEEMYNQDYCAWLKHFYKCLFMEECELEYDDWDIDKTCRQVWDAQYKIENKLKEELKKMAGEL